MMLDLPIHELQAQQAHVIRQQRRLEDAAWLATLRSTQQHNEHKEACHGTDHNEQAERTGS